MQKIQKVILKLQILVMATVLGTCLLFAILDDAYMRSSSSTATEHSGLRLHSDPHTLLGLKFEMPRSPWALVDGSAISSDLGSPTVVQGLINRGPRYLLVFALGLVFCLYLVRQASRRLIKPLQQYIDTMTRISRSRQIQVSDLELLRRHQTQAHVEEIAGLWDSFATMAEVIIEKSRDAADAAELLERKVEERTRDLKDAQGVLVQSGRMMALGEMASGIAHEINNPLSIIVAQSNMLRELMAGELDLDTRRQCCESVDRIEATALRISKIIKGLKSLSRDGAADPFDAVSAKLIVDDVKELCANRFKNFNIDFRLPPFNSKITLQCRSTQVGQVLMNLLNNSADAIERLPHKWIQLEVMDRETHVDFVVTDCGRGIPFEIREKIMDPFFTTKGVGKGTGLGLSISANIAKAHGGSLKIDSTCANTRFVLNLPKVQKAASKKAA